MRPLRILGLLALGSTCACGILLGSSDDDSDPPATPPLPDGGSVDGADLDAPQIIDDSGGFVPEEAGLDGGVDAANFPGRLAFVSTLTKAGSFAADGGLPVLEALCAQSAAAAGFSGAFTPYLFIGASTPQSRLPGGKPWYRADRTLVTSDLENVVAPINQNAFGVTTANDRVWTGDPGKTSGPALQTCSEWTSANKLISGAYGSLTAGPNAFRAGTLTCEEKAALYCFQK